MPAQPSQELAVALVVTLLLLWAAVDAALRPAAAYRTIGQRKPLWLLILILVPTAGPLLYLLVIRRKLRAVA